MKKLIEKKQNKFIECDNPKCDYIVSVNNKKDLFLFINRPCPKCGENLLTVKDYLIYQKISKIVDFINRWFSWILIFYPKKKLNKKTFFSIHVHDKITISQHKK